MRPALIKGARSSGARALCKYLAARLALVCLLLVQVASSPPDGRQQRPPGARALAAGTKYSRRPESSSSILADIEDLQDSSVRTRLGRVNIEHLGSAPGDFDQLIERIEPQPDARQHQHQQLKVSADANNKTSMRFFRNSKTFASIVYTNRESAAQPRRLINCHLVDLEKHASDVAIYEAKYDVRTVDVDFKDMMQLIEACTNIARLRRRPPNAIGQQPAASGSQYMSSGLQQQQQQLQARPVMVVGRPVPQATPTPGPAPASQAVFQEVMSEALNRELGRLGGPAPGDELAPLQLPTAAQFNETHNHPTGPELSGSRRRSTRRPQPEHHHHRKHSKRARFEPFATPQFYARLQRRTSGRQAPGGGPAHPLAGTLAKAHEQGKRLVLGEVTVPPTLKLAAAAAASAAAAAPGANGSSSLVREALQEISSYDTSDLLSIWRGILPGTNWCGMGDRASSYNDLGFESDIDICCRAHDFCPVRLAAFSSGYGLFNWSFYTRSHCWCDQNFLDCLQQAESPLSAVVMKFYFSIMRTTCLNDAQTEPNQQQQQQRALPSGASPQPPPPQIPALKVSQWIRTTRN